MPSRQIRTERGSIRVIKPIGNVVVGGGGAGWQETTSIVNQIVVLQCEPPSPELGQ
jgi:hypothetical protein